MVKIIAAVLALVVVVVIGILWQLKRSWGADSLGQVMYEMWGRAVPDHKRPMSTVNRLLIRKVKSAVITMPTGRKVLPQEIEIPISAEDHEEMEKMGGIEAFEADLAQSVYEHARKQKWQISGGRVRVWLTPNKEFRQGWVGNPSYRGTSLVRPAEMPRVEPKVTRQHRDMQKTDVLHHTKTRYAGSQHAFRSVLVLVGKLRNYEVESESSIIGRGDEADLCLGDNDLVSRCHAEILKVGEGWQLQDLGSSNGTYVDGVKINAVSWVPLREGSKVQIGKGGPQFTVKIERRQM